MLRRTLSFRRHSCDLVKSRPMPAPKSDDAFAVAIRPTRRSRTVFAVRLGVERRSIEPSCRRLKLRMRAGLHRRDRQRNGAKDCVGIVTPLGFDKPLGVAAVAFRDAIRIVADEKVGIPAKQNRRVERLARRPRPLPVSLLGESV